MTLDLSTLQVGDTITYDPGPVRRPATVVIVGPREVVARFVDAPPGEGHLIIRDVNRHNWSVVVPPPRCPITEPVTLRFVPGPELTSRPDLHQVELRHLPRITLHPPGAEIDGKRYVVCEVDEDDVITGRADREFILGTWDGAS